MVYEYNKWMNEWMTEWHDMTVCATVWMLYATPASKQAAAFCLGHDWIINQKTILLVCWFIFIWRTTHTLPHSHSHIFNTHAHTINKNLFSVCWQVQRSNYFTPSSLPFFFFFYSHFFLFWLSYLKISPSFALLLLCYPSLFLLFSLVSSLLPLFISSLLSSLFSATPLYFFSSLFSLLILFFLTHFFDYFLSTSTTIFQFLFPHHASFLLPSFLLHPPIHQYTIPSFFLPVNLHKQTYTFYIIDLRFIYLFIFIHFTSVC